jgi:hypothetical protein
VAFGVLHSIVWQRVVGGRRRSNRLNVRADVLGRGAPFIVLGALIGLAAITVAGAVAFEADGARHPVTAASVVVGVVVVIGGDRLMGYIRRVASRPAGAR